MILSNLEIQRALDDGKLIIEPEPLPRTPVSENGYCPYDTHSVDLKLHPLISIPEGGSFIHDPMKGGPIDVIYKHSGRHNLTSHQPFPLEPSVFVLARTLERIELPTDRGKPYLAARIEGKSSLARCGVLVHFTAPTVHPGFRGSLSLEMINFGPVAVLLRPEMPIAQLIVEQVTGELFENPSQFQDQSTPEGK